MTNSELNSEGLNIKEIDKFVDELIEEDKLINCIYCEWNPACNTKEANIAYIPFCTKLKTPISSQICKTCSHKKSVY